MLHIIILWKRSGPSRNGGHAHLMSFWPPVKRGWLTPVCNCSRVEGELLGALTGAGVFFFAAFGLLYVGLLQWVLYVSILTWVFPNAMVFANEAWSVKLRDTTGQIDMVGQVMVDQFFFSIFIYFPTFYIFKAVMLRLCRPHNTNSLPSSNNCVQTGLSEYWKNGATDLLANWAVWIPADVIIFAVPMYLRMPFEHAVSFGWSMFMSAMRGSTVQSDTKEVPGKAGTARVCETKTETNCGT